LKDQPREPVAELHAPLGMVVLLGALTAFVAISTDFYLPALPEIGRNLRASASETELTLAVFFLGTAGGQLFYGPLADRIGRRAPLLGGIALYTLASIGCAFATSIEALIALRLLQGLGGCAGVVIARAVVRDRFAPQETAHVFSMLMLVLGLAPILAPLAGGAMLTLAPWRALFWLLAGFGGACWVASFLSLKESLPPSVAELSRKESPFSSYLVLVRKPRLVGYMLYGALNTAALFTYITTSPDLFIQTYHVSPQAFGWLFGLNGAGLIAATQMNRWLLRRRSYDEILVWANGFGVASAALLAATAVTGLGGMLGVLGPLFLVVSGLGFNQANTLAGAMALDPQRAGATSALFGAGQFALGAAASALASALHDGTARPMALVIAGTLVVAGAALHLLAKPKAQAAA